jgi:hypothetical protein
VAFHTVIAAIKENEATSERDSELIMTRKWQ